MTYRIFKKTIEEVLKLHEIMFFTKKEQKRYSTLLKILNDNKNKNRKYLKRYWKEKKIK